jgi:hypothetical protein
MRRRRQPERLPHVHHRQPDPRTLLRPEPGIELSHALLRAVFTAKPDRTTTNEIADYDPVDALSGSRSHQCRLALGLAYRHVQYDRFKDLGLKRYGADIVDVVQHAKNIQTGMELAGAF